MTERAYRNCQWWVAPEAAVIGACKGGPPSATTGITEWPLTHSADWCGMFRLAERMAGGISDAEFEDAHKRMAERLETLGAKKETKQ